MNNEREVKLMIIGAMKEHCPAFIPTPVTPDNVETISYCQATSRLCECVSKTQSRCFVGRWPGLRFVDEFHQRQQADRDKYAKLARQAWSELFTKDAEAHRKGE